VYDLAWNGGADLVTEDDARPVEIPSMAPGHIDA